MYGRLHLWKDAAVMLLIFYLFVGKKLKNKLGAIQFLYIPSRSQRDHSLFCFAANQV